MINPYLEVDWNPDAPKLRDFGRTLMIGFPVLALAWFLGLGLVSAQWHHTGPISLALAGSLAGAVSRWIPTLGRPLYWIWFGIGCFMGLILGNLLLILFYYGVLSPIAIGLRLTGHKSYHLRPNPMMTSYWKPVANPDKITQYYKQF